MSRDTCCRMVRVCLSRPGICHVRCRGRLLRSRGIGRSWPEGGFLREGDQGVEEFRIGNAAGGHEARVHADVGEAGNGVDFVERDGAGGFVDEEVDAGHAFAAEMVVGGECCLPDLLLQWFGYAGRYVELCRAGYVFVVEVVEFFDGFDFAADGGDGLAVAADGDFDFPAPDGGFNKDFPVE